MSDPTSTQTYQEATAIDQSSHPMPLSPTEAVEGTASTLSIVACIAMVLLLLCTALFGAVMALVGDGNTSDQLATTIAGVLLTGASVVAIYGLSHYPFRTALRNGRLYTYGLTGKHSIDLAALTSVKRRKVIVYRYSVTYCLSCRDSTHKRIYIQLGGMPQETRRRFYDPLLFILNYTTQNDKPKVQEVWDSWFSFMNESTASQPPAAPLQ